MFVKNIRVDQLGPILNFVRVNNSAFKQYDRIGAFNIYFNQGGSTRSIEGQVGPQDLLEISDWIMDPTVVIDLDLTLTTFTRSVGSVKRVDTVEAGELALFEFTGEVELLEVPSVNPLDC